MPGAGEVEQKDHRDGARDKETADEQGQKSQDGSDLAESRRRRGKRARSRHRRPAAANQAHGPDADERQRNQDHQTPPGVRARQDHAVRMGGIIPASVALAFLELVEDALVGLVVIGKHAAGVIGPRLVDLAVHGVLDMNQRPGRGAVVALLLFQALVQDHATGLLIIEVDLQGQPDQQIAEYAGHNQANDQGETEEATEKTARPAAQNMGQGWNVSPHHFLPPLACPESFIHHPSARARSQTGFGADRLAKRSRGRLPTRPGSPIRYRGSTMTFGDIPEFAGSSPTGVYQLTFGKRKEKKRCTVRCQEPSVVMTAFFSWFLPAPC